jgi:hypothetical protein
MQNNVADIKLRAERKAGLLLKDLPKNAGQLSRGNIVLPRDETPTLEEIGITKMESSRLQLMAELDADDKSNIRTYQTTLI